MLIVCRTALIGYAKPYIHMLIRQYDPRAAGKMPKSAMIDKFIELNMPYGPRAARNCTAIVPFVADHAADNSADHVADHAADQIVDFGETNRKMRKAKRKMTKKWLKGASLIRRKILSKDIVAELRKELRPGIWPQWTVASLREHVGNVVGKSLHAGHPLIFFGKKLQQLLPKKRLKRKPLIKGNDWAVPKAGFIVIADSQQ